MIFALQPGARPSVVLIRADGRAKRFVSLAAGLALSGIAFDSTGHFGHRLLVTARHNGQTSVLAMDCAGGVRTITTRAPGMEGGIAVAPVSFGRYGGDLIGPNESTGQVFAVAPDGKAATLVVSGLPHGGDIGVESAGFVPPGFGPGDLAYLADRYSRGNKHPGTDSILRLPGQELVKAGVRTGDLLVATEGKRQDHRRPLREFLHGKVHRHWPGHHARRGTHRIHPPSRVAARRNRARRVVALRTVVRSRDRPARYWCPGRFWLGIAARSRAGAGRYEGDRGELSLFRDWRGVSRSRGPRES